MIGVSLDTGIQRNAASNSGRIRCDYCSWRGEGCRDYVSISPRPILGQRLLRSGEIRRDDLRWYDPDEIMEMGGLEKSF
jgi:hypothetical protein